jgi:hypothetical protein
MIQKEWRLAYLESISEVDAQTAHVIGKWVEIDLSA